jgi:Glycosyl transferase family 2
MTEATEPMLSVVVTVVSDTTGEADPRHLLQCLAALERQVDSPSKEVLVACDGRFRGVEELQKRFPHVRFIRVENLRTLRRGPTREHHDELRGIGIRQARAELIGFLEDQGCPDPDWCAQMVREHREPHAAVGGAIENGVDRPLNWAVYFSDFWRYQNPVRRGPTDSLSDANVCYRRTALNRVSSAWADSYNEIRVHAALRARGEALSLSPDVVVYQQRLDLRLGRALLERYIWGRSYAATRSANLTASRRIALAMLAPGLPLLLLQRQLRSVLRKRRNRGAFFRALPLLALLTVVWSFGEWVGYLTARPAGAGAAEEAEGQRPA